MAGESVCPTVEFKLMRKVVLLAAVLSAASSVIAVSARQPVRARHAAVAVGFALAVTHPSAGNIGGGGFLVARFADGRTTFVDFRERAPQKASRDMYIGPDGKATRDS